MMLTFERFFLLIESFKGLWISPVDKELKGEKNENDLLYL